MNQFVRAEKANSTFDSSSSLLSETLIETFEQEYLWLNAKGTREELVAAS